jgi:hypothetical protein
VRAARSTRGIHGNVGYSIVTHVYSLYSCRLTVDAWPELLAAIHGRLEPFVVDEATTCDLAVSFAQSRERSIERALPALAGRRVYDFPNGHVAYDDARDVLTIAVGDRIHAVCEPAAGHARITGDSPNSTEVWLLSHPVLSLVLMELLKRRGFFPVHAAGLALGGRGVLLAGTSGAGKSTLSIALARGGFAFLSDDTVFLEADASGWRVRSFPDQVDLCADAVHLFPELQTVAEGGRAAGWPKWQIRPEQVYGAPIPIDVAPRVLIFPSVCGTPTSALTPLSPAEALLELAPNVLLTDAITSQRHLDALAGIVAQCACYRLDTGRDLDDAVSVVRGAIAS